MRGLLALCWASPAFNVKSPLTLLHGCTRAGGRVRQCPLASLSLSAPAADATADALKQLCDMVNRSRSVVVLTGAGISTDSGIPDYRGPAGAYLRGHKPMQHDEFMATAAGRQRYWGRSMAGWQFFSTARPNKAHFHLADLEAKGKVNGIITQNVDRLHSKAGSANVIDLHGRNDRVVCVSCGVLRSRRIFQAQLAGINQAWLAELAAARTAATAGGGSGNGGGCCEADTAAAAARPDGDAELGVKTDYSGFVVPPCDRCDDGILKPDVTFFGDSVPPERVEAAFAMVDAADSILVLGTSLMVYSGFRFVGRAVQQGKPIAVVNRGYTRAEKAGLPIIKVEEGCAEALARLVERRGS
ncbi:unnamed protein product [Phaeothamnion confervicola]